jgi:hypothetical protein
VSSDQGHDAGFHDPRDHRHTGRLLDLTGAFEKKIVRRDDTEEVFPGARCAARARQQTGLAETDDGSISLTAHFASTMITA